MAPFSPIQSHIQGQAPPLRARLPTSGRLLVSTALGVRDATRSGRVTGGE
jgi:hypothetical protein